MTSQFMRIEMGKALHGDCLFVEWGGATGKHRMLIDGGPIGSYDVLARRIAALPAAEREFELVVLSHVDTDHIEGMVRLFSNPPAQWPLQVKDVWFNGWHHMDELDAGVLGGRQGEFFSALLAHRLEPGKWNGAFNSNAVVVPPSGRLPVMPLAGGMKLTLLSPTHRKLDKMREAWCKDLKATGITPGDLEVAWKSLSGQKKYLPEEGLLSGGQDIDALLMRQFKPDAAAANGSSIAFLAEHPAGSCLFLADAHADVVCESLKRLLQERGVARLAVDAVKVSHHGSKNNTDPALAGLIDSPRYLFSTNGAIFKHPNEETVARILEAAGGQPVQLFFNYANEFNSNWNDPALQERLNYRTTYDTDEAGPLVVTLGC